MEYRKLGRTGLNVSPLVLGTVNFGWLTNEEGSFEILDYAMDTGLNFFDTSNNYNAGKTEFLDDFRQRYEARQLVFELKNVRSLESSHTNQLHRYLGGEFGRVGILTTRNPVPRAVRRNLVDLHSSKRAIILVLSDGDLSLMVDLLEAQLRPVEAVKRRYIEFTRLLPS